VTGTGPDPAGFFRSPGPKSGFFRNFRIKTGPD